MQFFTSSPLQIPLMAFVFETVFVIAVVFVFVFVQLYFCNLVQFLIGVQRASRAVGTRPNNQPSEEEVKYSSTED